jgi:hypothetical protein
VNVATQRLRVRTTLEDDAVSDEEERDAAKGEEAPLVRGLNQRADEPCHDHDLVHEDHVQNRGRGHAAGQEQIREQEGRCNEPVDVLDNSLALIAKAGLGERILVGGRDGRMGRKGKLTRT